MTTISFVLPRRSPIPPHIPLSVFPTHSYFYFIHSNNSTCSDSATVFHPLFSTMTVLHFRFSVVMVFFCCKFSMFYNLIYILTYCTAFPVRFFNQPSLFTRSHSVFPSEQFVMICNAISTFIFFHQKISKALGALMRQLSTPKHLLQKYNRS